VRRGEVWWYEHPGFKRRPALVLTRNEAIAHLNEVFVVLATTTIRGLPTEVELGREDGMPTTCVLNTDQIDAADKVYLIEHITTLGPDKLSKVCHALDYATGC
jgi:mRNA interferase MazF